MGHQSSAELAVCRWSAWAPGLSDAASWRGWAKGSTEMAGAAVPDVRFVEPMLRRRLSFLSRMAFRVATDCLDGERSPPVCIFASRYGEALRSTEILYALAKDEPVSPTDFSLSVHNTALSLLSIARHDTAPWMALAGCEATLETAFLAAWSQLQEGSASSALIIYHDEHLPPPFEDQATSVTRSAAFALLLRLPEAASDQVVLRLEWGANGPLTKSGSVEPHLDVLRLLLAGGSPVVLQTERLRWTWSAHGTAA